MSEVCDNTDIEPKLTPLSGKVLPGMNVKQFKRRKGRYQNSTFLRTRATDIFQLQDFDSNAWRYRKKSLQRCHVMNEQKKRKRAYNERIVEIDHTLFTSLMFSTNGSMGRKCQKFYSRLAQMISEIRDLPQSISRNWIQTKVCFGLLESSLLCLKGSTTVYRKTAEFEIDVDVSHTISKI